MIFIQLSLIFMTSTHPRHAHTPFRDCKTPPHTIKTHLRKPHFTVICSIKISIWVGVCWSTRVNAPSFKSTVSRYIWLLSTQSVGFPHKCQQPADLSGSRGEDKQTKVFLQEINGILFLSEMCLVNFEYLSLSHLRKIRIYLQLWHKHL